MRVMQAAGFILAVAAVPGAAAAQSPKTVDVTYPASLAKGPLDGRLLLLLSTDDKAEPRLQISDTSLGSQQVFGIDVDGWKPGDVATFDAGRARLSARSACARCQPGTYTAQALLHQYETFSRADGHAVKLPMDRGEGQQWNRAPGNLYSTPRKIVVEEPAAGPVDARARPGRSRPSADPPTTKYVKHERIRSERLSKFWGRDMYLGAHVLLPEGFDEHPQARYPLVINHGHFPADFGGFRRGAARPQPEVRVLATASSCPCYNRTCRSTRTSSTRTGRRPASRACW